MKRTLIGLFVILAVASRAEIRDLELLFKLVVREVPAGSTVLTVEVPMPRDDEQQVLAEYLVGAGHPATVLQGAEGNRRLRVVLPPAPGGESRLSVRFRIARFDPPRPWTADGSTAGARPFLARLMPPDRRILEPSLSMRDEAETVRDAIARWTGPEGEALRRGLSSREASRALHQRFVEELLARGVPARLAAGLALSGADGEGAPMDALTWAEYRLSGAGWTAVDLDRSRVGLAAEDRVPFTVTVPGGGKGGGGPVEGVVKPLVEIDGIRYHDLEAEWSGREAVREPVTLVLSTRGRRN